MKKMILALIAVSLFGCGGGGGSGGPVAATPTTATGKFVDAPVEGLRYVSGAQSGFTGPNGEFTYEVGQPVTFSVGGVVIGQAPGGGTITPIDLVNAATSGTGASATTPAVVQIVQFLLTACSTTATGIKIDAAVTAAAASQNINLSTASGASVTAMLSQVAAAAGNRPVTSATDAQNHITASMAGLATGTVVIPSPTITGGGGTATYKLRLQGSFAAGTVGAVQFHLQLPASVTVKTVAGGSTSVAAVNGESLFISGSAPAGALLTAGYSSGTLNIGVLAVSPGLSSGEFATLVCNVKAGMSAPAAAEFVISNLTVIDTSISQTPVSGATVTVN